MKHRLQEYYFGVDRLNGESLSGCLLLRHAEREPILTWEDIEIADLTPAGRKQAYSAGRALAGKVKLSRIVASSVLRCMHSAEEIGRGYHDACGIEVPVLPLPALNYDSRKWNAPAVPQVILEDTTLARLFNHTDGLEARQLAGELLDQLQLDGDGQLVLAVTHDTIITLVAGVLAGVTGLTVADSPGFLKGVHIQPAGSEPHLNYRLALHQAG